MQTTLLKVLPLFWTIKMSNQSSQMSIEKRVVTCIRQQVVGLTVLICLTQLPVYRKEISKDLKDLLQHIQAFIARL